MGRNLPFGRLNKEDIPDSVRKTGTATYGNKAAYGPYFDQALFEIHQEYILGSASQLSSDFATIVWSNSNARFEDKAGDPVTLGDYERITVIGMDTLTSNIVIDNVTGLQIRHLGGTTGQAGDNPKFQLGDVGGGEPYKIKLGPNTEDCFIDILTDKPFEDLLRTLTLDQKRYIANQGKNNYIRVNGVEIYNPSRSGEIFPVDVTPSNPYFVRMDGRQMHWSADASNANLAWFRDLNIRLGGLRSDGTNLLETQSKFTESAIITASPYIFQVNTANRFLTDLSALDTRLHERSSPTAPLSGARAPVGTLATGSDVVTFAVSPFEGDIKNGMRIREPVSGTYLPVEVSNTVILVDIDTTAHTAKMIDALTGAPVNSTGTSGPLGFAVDNSGAASGSIDDDYITNITGSADIRPAVTATTPADQIITNPTGAFNFTSAGGTGQSTPLSAAGALATEHLVDFDASLAVNTHYQTQPKSSAVLYFYRP
jgi:hypothetical protein